MDTANSCLSPYYTDRAASQLLMADQRCAATNLTVNLAMRDEQWTTTDCRRTEEENHTTNN